MRNTIFYAQHLALSMHASAHNQSGGPPSLRQGYGEASRRTPKRQLATTSPSGGRREMSVERRPSGSGRRVRRCCAAFNRGIIPAFTLGIFLSASVQSSLAQDPRRRISEDRDLKTIDLTAWDCLDKLEGTAKTPDGVERNRFKNRSPTDLTGLRLPDLTVSTFIQSVASFDALTPNKRRKDLSPAERQQLGPLEKDIVQITGYLGVAYAGPPETCNCASVDFHDWHLEIFEKPIDHPPQPGDTTPIICEITPRTQNAIFGDNIRIQELTAFFRRADTIYESTGHPARKIRLIGYRLWDDDHNGRADIGTTVKKHSPNGYHNPWRQTAWEIHPVIKIIPLEPPMPAKNAPVQPAASGTPAAATTVTPAPAESSPLTSPAPETPPPIPTATPVPQPQVVIITKAVPIQIPYGQIMLQPGTKLPFVSRDGQSVTVRYMGEKYTVPTKSTDLEAPTSNIQAPEKH